MKRVIKENETDWASEFGVYAINKNTRLVENTSAVRNYTVEIFPEEEEDKISDRLAARLAVGKSFEYTLYDGNMKLIGYAYNACGLSREEMIKAITEQVINMYSNNVLQDNGAEGFEGWCADGEVFTNNGYTEEEADAMMDLVRDMAPCVDALTFGWLNTDKSS